MLPYTIYIMTKLKQNTRIQAQVRMKQVDTFKHQLEEGNAVTLHRYVLGEIQPKYRMVKNGLRLSFLANTVVEKCNDFSGSIYGFDFRTFKTITNLGVEEDGQFGKHICLLYYICSCNECN
jgi:hypothetical protein